MIQFLIQIFDSDFVFDSDLDKDLFDFNVDFVTDLDFKCWTSDNSLFFHGSSKNSDMSVCFWKKLIKKIKSNWNYGLILQMASIFNRFPNIYLYVHYTNKCLWAIENPKSIVNNCKIVYRVEINPAFLELSKDD